MLKEITLKGDNNTIPLKEANSSSSMIYAKRGDKFIGAIVKEKKSKEDDLPYILRMGEDGGWNGWHKTKRDLIVEAYINDKENEDTEISFWMEEEDIY